MSTRPSPSPAAPNPPSGGRRWLATSRGRVVAALAAVVIVGGVVVGVTDPFAGSGRSGGGVVDNSYPTALATVRERSISSQTEVSASLGYSGSYAVAIPTGTPASAIIQDRSAVQSAQQRFLADQQALASDKRLQHTSDKATVVAANATVHSDEVTLSLAKTMLGEDEALACPVASESTVTTPFGSSASTGSRGSGDPSGDSSAADDETTTTTLSTPEVTIGAATTVSQTSESLSGTVDPGNLDTTYYFEWGTTSAFGSQSTAADAGDGTTPVPVTATISGLQPDTTYAFTLFAENARGTSVAPTETFETAQSSCAAERQVIAEDARTLAQDRDALAADKVNNKSTLAQAESTVATDRASLAAAEAALLADEAEATNPGSVFTALPSLGERIYRGQSVYSLGGRPVPLFFGTTTLYRALYLGVSDGPDVTELSDNLIALGFGRGIGASPHFSAATKAAVEAWQRSLGLPATGIVSLGDVVVEPGPLRVTTVTAALGGTAQAGSPVLTASSTARVVTIDLDVSLVPDVKVGDTVGITLPNNVTTPGVVTSVGTVATSAGSGATGQGGPTVTVLVAPLHPAATGLLDQASV
ncbi:MAG TPA: peptidoglycan-binding protein, partial [Acidimicrobiales bacterium]|nr:peptidoglycan-binding protein [Acidimicrobiales bacterium]